MAEEMDDLDGMEFEEVEAETPRHGSANRGPKGGTLYPSGRFVMNVGGSEELLRLVQVRSLETENFRVSFGRGQGDLVAVYARPHGDAGTADVRRNADRKTFTVYIHSFFDRYPTLRPVGTQKCKVRRSKDAKGMPCLVFHANGGLDKRTQHRDSSDEHAEQPKGGEQTSEPKKSKKQKK